MTARPASPSVLCWEWRTFAPELSWARARLPDLSGVKAQRSRDTYIVSALVPHNTKIRSDDLDVRRLVKVGTQGLELWDPVIKDMFPITAETAARLFGIWRVPLPGFERRHYSLTLFLEELVSRTRDLHLVDVEQTRCGFAYQGCTAELSQIVMNGMPLETLCLEHEDEAMVLGAVADLGVADTRNVSYPQAIKGVLGLTALPEQV